MAARAHGLLTASAFLLALTACTGDGGPSPSPSDSPSTPPPSATEGDAQSPSVLVLDAPAGYERGAVVNELSSAWSEVLAAEGGCTLTARSQTEDGTTPDMRAASVAEVEDMAAGDGASTPDVADLEMVTSGAGEGNDPAHTRMFVGADWTTDDQAVRGLARVTNAHHYHGSQSSQMLALRFMCPGQAIDEAEWETVAAVIRPVMYGQVGPDDPWADRTSD